MFGYVNAHREQLSDDDKVTYQRFYCGLCQELHKQAGFKGQLLLNYDLCFLAILLQSLYEVPCDTKAFRCIIHPVFQKHGYLSQATEYAAAMDIMLSYYSLLDKYNDDSNRLALTAARSISSCYDKLKEKYPRQAAAIENYIDKLSDAEIIGETNIDLVASYTGDMLAELFNWKDDEWKAELSSIGFYLGKFIYIIDAYDDLKKDEKKGSYNPLASMKKQTPKEYETFIRVTLTSLMAECAKSFERLPIVENIDILRNIIYSGVWNRYEYLQLKDKKRNNKEKQ